MVFVVHLFIINFKIHTCHIKVIHGLKVHWFVSFSFSWNESDNENLSK